MSQQDDIDISDETLVSRVRGGDSDAFCLLARRHGARYRALAYRFVADMMLAEDLVQEAFVKLWTHAHKFDESKAKFTTWFHRIVVNKCLDEKRKRKPDPLPEGFDAPDQDVPVEQRLALDSANQKLLKALSDLSERQKTAVTLSYLDGLPNMEAATVMDLNIKAYESLLVRSRTKMRQALAAQKDELMAAIGRG